MEMEPVLAKEASRRDVVEEIESTLFDFVTQWNTSNKSPDAVAVEFTRSYHFRCCGRNSRSPENEFRSAFFD